MNYRKKARKNGEKAEKEALKYLKALPLFFTDRDEDVAIELINDLVDIYINEEVYVEVKSCQAWVRDNSSTSKKRRGRFRLKREQHQFLCDSNGYYVFVVHCDKTKKAIMKLIKAENIDFPKSELLSWKKVFKDLA
jgi:hypothetical protein